MIKKVIALSIGLVAIITLSCQKEPTSGNIPGGAAGGGQSGSSLMRVAENMGRDLGELTTSEGFVSIMAISGKIKNSDAFNFGGFGSSKSNRSAVVLKKLSNTLKNTLIRANLPRVIAYKFSDKYDNRKLNKTNDEEDTLSFNFSAHTGIYQYNPSTEQWDKIGSSNYIIFIMDVDVPDPQDTSIYYTKTAVLTIYCWDEQRFELWDYETNEEKIVYLPTKIKMDLKVDNNLVATYDYTSAYNSTTALPLNVVSSLSLPPFALNATYADAGQNITSSISLSKNGSNLIGFGASIDFYSRTPGAIINVDENDNIEDTQFKKFSLWMQVYTLRITLTVNMEALHNISDPTPEMLNDALTITITDNGIPVGSIEFYKESDCQEDCELKVRFIFEDGSTGELEEFFGDIIDKINELFGDEENDKLANK